MSARTAARMTPLAETDIPARLCAALRPVTHPRGLDNLFTTLARSPATLEAYLPLGLHLFSRSALPADVREGVILRVAARAGCEYETAQHRSIARRAGLTDEQIDAAADLARTAVGPAPHTAALAAVDELFRAGRVSDETWSALARFLDAEQLIDLLVTAGFYCMLAWTLNSLGVQLDERLLPTGADRADGDAP